MKSLMVLVVGLLAVGCATVKDICVQLGISKPNTPEQKQKTLRDSVVGEYEWKRGDGYTQKWCFMERYVYLVGNGIEGEKTEESFRWSIESGQIQIFYTKKGELIRILIYRINQDKSITYIAGIENGKRIDWPKDNQITYKKIK